MQLAFVVLAVLAVSVPARPADESRIPILLSTDSDIYLEGLAGIRLALDNARLETVEESYLNVLQANGTAALEQYFRAREDSRLIIALGPAAARAAYRYARRPTVVFSMVTSPRLLRKVAGNRPLCGLSMHVPVEEYFRTLRELQPGARRVLAFHSSPEGEYLAGEGRYFDQQHGLIYESRRIDDPADFAEALETSATPAGIDAIYMTADPLYNRTNFRLLQAYAKREGVVLMTGFRRLVDLGATFGYSPDYARLGLLTGDLAGRILSGSADCATEGVIFPERSDYFFFLNADFSRESGIEPPPALVQRDRLTGLSRTGIRLFRHQKYNSARRVFEAILEQDEGHRTAAYYLEQTLARQSGGQLAELMARAKAAEQRGDPGHAVTIYRNVLELHPGHDTAQRGLVRSRAAHAEQFRRQAQALANRAPYEALRRLQTALRIDPNAAQIHRDLSRLRRKLSVSLPTLMQRGISDYEARRYEAAITNFENVLLVEPNRRAAGEYLRLSRRKLDAIRRLQSQK